MKKNRIIIWFIIFLTVASALIDLPDNFRLKFNIGKYKVDQIISSPDINISLGPLNFYKEIKTHFGLDLSGGSHLVLEADMKKIAPADRNQALDSAKSVVERRVNLYGLTEPIVQSSKVGSSHRILVELPGVKDVGEAVDLIGRTAQLAFYQEATDAAKLATQSAYINVWTVPTSLTGKNLRRSQVSFNPQTGKPEVTLEFDSQGAKLFEDITRKNIGKTLAIFLDNQIISAPRVNSAISGGKAVIEGSFTTDEAKQLSIALNAGALPVPIKVIEQRSIGATLGEESINKSFQAGLIGLSIILIFMIVNYGKLGFTADLALIFYVLVTFALFKTIPITLTLAGIAGFILSIGMAVDANILIFERAKEEIRWGKDKNSAIKLGFDRAFPSIRDSNISSLITCIILYWFGTGIVRGFAITLAIGIAISLFSAITVTRTLLRYIYK
ncbi:protein-export membrane protein SecD [Candidatus Gottesmanbacteria bacterium RIFCSPHIGHO2_01_FULL_39_10]|uniref:Protein translocase subunit SecD n=1 Tax=Candidatus Gottesmanbacteria bacterium RIFCSPHIGHO2_01_FULL_39_10 TaxID=1798375 RepID=A0A1F5ZRP9_9BACT|nr:MAG: protein-export membrane protein SecD [Candidatus Gottesmanbacteria bacterium RIFCSPHIGHO2_01_FULL_39_10]